MACSNHPTLPRAALLALICAALAGCSVTGPRESPLNEITRGSPTVLDIYRGGAGSGGGAVDAAGTPLANPRAVMNSKRPIAAGDEATYRYWSALEPMRQRFGRIPNPDLVMVVYPHLAQGKYPVPGYVTVFPMYEQTFYALPGELSRDLIVDRALPFPTMGGGQ